MHYNYKSIFKNLQAKMGDSINCTSWSISVKKSTVTSRSPLNIYFKKYYMKKLLKYRGISNLQMTNEIRGLQIILR